MAWLHHRIHLAGTTKKRKPHALVSMRRAAEITGMADYQLRYLEDHYDPARSFGYPGRSGTNLEFVKTALSHWAANHLSAQRAEKAIKAGLKNPLHRPGL